MITLRKVSENATSILLGWDPITNAAGFKFTVQYNGAPTKISHTWDGSRTTVRVDKNAAHVLVEALGVKDTGTWPNEPPPDPTFPPAWADFSDDFDPQPSSRWTWMYGNTRPGFPNVGASLVSDGSGGKAVRLTSPQVGGSGQLSSFFDGSGQWGTNGVHQMGQAKIRRVNQDQFIWVWEWHENIGVGINSCAIGLNPNRTTRIQVSGGPASGHQYTEINDSRQLDGEFNLYEWDIIWSPTNTGRFKVWLDGRVICDVQRPTLLTSGGRVDTTVIGGYCYTPPGSNGAQVMDFTDVAVGAV